MNVIWSQNLFFSIQIFQYKNFLYRILLKVVVINQTRKMANPSDDLLSNSEAKEVLTRYTRLGVSDV